MEYISPSISARPARRTPRPTDARAPQPMPARLRTVAQEWGQVWQQAMSGTGQPAPAPAFSSLGLTQFFQTIQPVQPGRVSF